jgi:branched-subunit amino acid aminotransferase/4-amino-4-deoxychorismate lyase
MIWVGGKIVPDDALKICVLDRTFEHGLGLFETLRTWDGQAPLLDRHLERMKRSARELGLPLDGVVLPDAEAVSNLLGAEDTTDLMLRITLSGGLSETGGATLWMRTAPLPLPFRREGAIVDLHASDIDVLDPLSRHKTLNYWPRRRAFERARGLGFDEVLSTVHGRIWEGSRSNVFLVRRSILWTPSLDGPIVPGIMRALVLELAAGLGWEVRLTDLLAPDDLANAPEVFLTNSVRGIMPVARVGAFPSKAHGEWTRRLSLLVSDWLKGRAHETGGH